MRPSRLIVAENVRRNRLARGWTQVRLAREANIPQSRIAEMEAAKHEQRTDTIDRIASALGVPPATLLIPVEVDESAALTG